MVYNDASTGAPLTKWVDGKTADATGSNHVSVECEAMQIWRRDSHKKRQTLDNVDVSSWKPQNVPQLAWGLARPQRHAECTEPRGLAWAARNETLT